MRRTIAIAMGLALLFGAWGCGKKDADSAPASPPASSPPPGTPAAPPGAAAPAAPAAPASPGAPGMPGMPGVEAPAASSASPAPAGAAKPAEPKASKKDDHSDDPFSSGSNSGAAASPGMDSAKPGKTTTAGALGRALFNAGRSVIPGAGGEKAQK